MIRLSGFTKIYGSSLNPSVKDFNMECLKGQLTGILGPNGAGKTTILKAVTARHFATEGKVEVEGTDCSENPSLVKNLTGFVMENSDLPEEFYVHEYLENVAVLHGVCSENLGDTLNKVKESCSLEEVWNKKIGSLSKGFRERVNFAQALVYNPSVIVLDEPASGLDPAQILRMRELVKSLKNEHTIVLSTHLMQEVDALCDRVYIIDHGRELAHGTPGEIAAANDSSSLEEAFFKLVRGEE